MFNDNEEYNVPIEKMWKINNRNKFHLFTKIFCIKKESIAITSNSDKQSDLHKLCKIFINTDVDDISRLD